MFVHDHVVSQMAHHLISDSMGGVDLCFLDIGSQMEDAHRMSNVGT